MKLADVMLFADGRVDAVAIASLQKAMRAWLAGEAAIEDAAGLPRTRVRRAARDVMIGALALAIAPDAGPAKRARRVAKFIASIDRDAPPSTTAQRIALRLLAQGEPIPEPRQLQNVLRSESAMQEARDYLNGLLISCMHSPDR